MININDIDYHNKTSAPWVSTEIFVQGCNQNCSECFNQDLREIKDSCFKSTRTIVSLMDKYVPYLAVTFSGGEPMLQAKGLSKIAKKLYKKGFIIICYTGYEYEHLDQIPHSRKLLENIDILVDGRYIKEQRILTGEDFSFVGSSNQRIIDVPASLALNKIILLNDETKKSYYDYVMHYSNGSDYINNNKRLLA